MNREKGLTSAHLKYIAIALMLLDHIGSFFRRDILQFNQNIFGVEWPWDYYIYAAVFLFGRIAFPVFAFQLSEGIRHTRSPEKYIGRLFLFGVISELPYRFMQQVLAGEQLYLDFAFRNVMFTMLLAVAACYIYQQLCKRGIPVSGAMMPAVMLILLAEWLQTDYGGAGVALVFTLYLVSRTGQRVLLLTMWTVYTYIINSWSEGNFYGQYGRYYISVALLCTAYALLAVPLIAAYNGRKGKTPRYLFYLFYPVHLWVLAGLYFIFKLR